MLQLILNLTRNGLEAMPPGRYLTITTFQGSEEVVLAVKDEGCGISENVLNKIDAPFFTTKNEGTGLGLSICYSIASRHNAYIDIVTGPEGTTIYMRFRRNT